MVAGRCVPAYRLRRPRVRLRPAPRQIRRAGGSHRRQPILRSATRPARRRHDPQRGRQGSFGQPASIPGRCKYRRAPRARRSLSHRWPLMREVSDSSPAIACPIGSFQPGRRSLALELAVHRLPNRRSPAMGRSLSTTHRPTPRGYRRFPGVLGFTIFIRLRLFDRTDSSIRRWTDA